MLFSSLKEGKNANFPGVSPTVLGETKLVSQHLSLLRLFPLCNIFPIIGSDSLHILMKMFEDHIFILYLGSLGFV